MRKNDDLEINAYVDGELTTEERMELLTAMQRDPELARMACATSTLKNQLQLAYANPPGLDPGSRNRFRPTRLTLAASLVMLVAGLFGGWLVGHSPNGTDRFVMLDSDGRGQAPATADSTETRIVFHVTSADQSADGELLDDVEQMLNAYQQEGKPLRVEIVTNGDGLDLLRERLSHYRAKIHQLASKYKNLTFVACKNTIDRVQVSEGVEVHILPDAEITGSGVDHVVKRQKEGWVYIRV